MPGLLFGILACSAPPPLSEAPPPDSGSPAPVDSAPAPEDCPDPPTWYLDHDGDGLGDASQPLTACEAPPGYVATPGDCDDGDPALDAAIGQVHWVRVPADVSGLRQPHRDPQIRRCSLDFLAGGAAVGDIDDDGDLDLFLPRLHAPDELLRNDGTGRFEPDPAFAGDPGSGSGALFVDVDGDVDLDLVVARLAQERPLLYVNDGAGGFVEEGAARGMGPAPAEGCSHQLGVTAGDVDADGDLDLLLAAWVPEADRGTADNRSVLLRNDGTGHFTDATGWLGPVLRQAPFGFLLADLDRDGLPDLHSVSDWGGSQVLRNTGDGFALLPSDGLTDENGMGADLGDVDGDLDLDWFVGSIFDDAVPCPDGWGCSGNRLYARDPGGYRDVTGEAGVRDGAWVWGSAFLDYDLDGDLDLACTGGYDVAPFVARTGQIWRNDGAGRFSDVTCETGWLDRGQGRTVLPLDADRDGDLDLLLVDATRPPMLWRAEGAEDRAHLTLQLRQPGANPYAIGAEVVVRPSATAPPQLRLLHAHTLYMGGPAPEVHFGLGDHAGPIAEVRVRWPDGAETVHGPIVGEHTTIFRSEEEPE